MKRTTVKAAAAVGIAALVIASCTRGADDETTEVQDDAQASSGEELSETDGEAGDVESGTNDGILDDEDPTDAFAALENMTETNGGRVSNDGMFGVSNPYQTYNSNKVSKGAKQPVKVNSSYVSNAPLTHAATVAVDYAALYNEAKVRYDKALANYNKAFSTANAEMKAQLEVELADALRVLGEAKARYNEAIKQQATAQGVLQNKQSLLAQATAEVNKAKADRQNAIDAAQDALDAQHDIVTNAQKSKADAEKNIKSLNSAYAVLQTELEEAKGNVSEAEDALADAETALRIAREANAEEIAAAEKRVALAEAGLADAEGALESAESMLADLKKDLADAEATLANAQSAYDAEVLKVSEAAADLLEKVNTAESEVAKQQTSLAGAVRDFEDAEEAVSEAEGVLAETQKALENISPENEAKLQNALSEAEDAYLAAQKDLEAKKTALAEAQKTLTAEEAKYTQMVDEMSNPMDWEGLELSDKLTVLADMVGALINDHRVQAGLNPLPMSHEKNALATEWSKVMSDHGDIGHMFDDVTKYDDMYAENIAWNFISGRVYTDMNEEEGGRVLLRHNIDEDPETIAWAMVQQWRNSHLHYVALMGTSMATQSVGLYYDPETYRVYMTWRGYSSDKGQTLYMPTSYEDEFGFETKRVEFTGMDYKGINYTGEYNYNQGWSGNPTDFDPSGVEAGYGEGIEDTRPTQDDVDAQAKVVEYAGSDVTGADSALATAQGVSASTKADYTEAQDALEVYLKAKEEGENALALAEADLAVAEMVYGKASAQYEDAKNAVLEAEATLADLQKQLDAIPGIEDVDKSAVIEAQDSVNELTDSVAKQEGVVDSAENAVEDAETEKADADNQLAEANKGLEDEIAGVAEAKNTLADAEAEVESIETEMDANRVDVKKNETVITDSENAITEAEKVIPELEVAVAEAEAVVVDTSKQEAAQAEVDTAQQTKSTADAVVAETQQGVSQAQADVNTAEEGINSIEASQNNAEATLKTTHNNLDDAAKNAGVEPEFGATDPFN